MTLILKVVAALGLFVTACYSACNMEKNTLIGRGRFHGGGCWRDGGMHPLLSKWKTDDCLECTCYRQGMECCSQDSIAVGFNPKLCLSIKVNCTLKVVSKKNHLIQCPFKLVEIDSDSSDSTDGKVNGNTKKTDSSDNNGGKISVADYLELLSYFDNTDDCVEKKEEKKFTKPWKIGIKRPFFG